MSGINKVIIVGRLGLDPEVKTIDGGNTVARLSIATSESWSDKAGKKQERTEWHNVTCWGKLADLCSNYLSKGRQVYIEGKLQTRSWEDKTGVKKYATEIVASKVEFLGGETAKPKNTIAPEAMEPEFNPEINPSEDMPF